MSIEDMDRKMALRVFQLRADRLKKQLLGLPLSEKFRAVADFLETGRTQQWALALARHALSELETPQVSPDDETSDEPPIVPPMGERASAWMAEMCGGDPDDNDGGTSPRIEGDCSTCRAALSNEFGLVYVDGIACGVKMGAAERTALVDSQGRAPHGAWRTEVDRLRTENEALRAEKAERHQAAYDGLRSMGGTTAAEAAARRADVEESKALPGAEPEGPILSAYNIDVQDGQWAVEVRGGNGTDWKTVFASGGQSFTIAEYPSDGDDEARDACEWFAKQFRTAMRNLGAPPERRTTGTTGDFR